ncbi:MAG: bifunctional folylpolyglutamate synthase/dihydrofolate synthase [Streptococcaceae bacterium]|jgi:dihydrofolate synthase/folylpolyglutamate synthase|nr:bifunctional folylpolyglutamate synthase/dihydrofolate synthase [Streptococcaceae bacterium]
MNVTQATNWIHSRLKFGIKPGLDRVYAILDLLDNPQEKTAFIHIAGTNGKGSTTTFIRNIFTKQGLKVGSFTSPYIEKFNERISIDGIGIPDEKLVEYVQKIQPLVAKMDADEHLKDITEFEIITALAFDYFYHEKVDLAVIEVGLGGLLDSTNVITPIVSGITTIGMDHMDILGDTLEKIAFQKAGIIKANTPVVTGNIQPEALTVIREVASEKSANMIEYMKDYQIKIQEDTFTYFSKNQEITHLQLSLLGHHQMENAAMAIEVAKVFAEKMTIELTQDTIREGLKEAFWPARMEQLRKTPLVILDGAHNVDAMKRLVENLQNLYAGKKLYLLFSALETKDITQMLDELATLSNARIYLTTFDYPKALDLNKYQYLEDERCTIVSDWRFGLAEIMEKMKEEDVFVITGSLYFSSQVRQYYLQKS